MMCSRYPRESKIDGLTSRIPLDVVLPSIVLGAFDASWLAWFGLGRSFSAMAELHEFIIDQ